PEAFTPDNEFLLGESAVRGFYVAAGFCAHGIAGAGGMGAAMAEWIIDGEPSLDLWKMDLRRFGGQYRSQAYTLGRTVEVSSTSFAKIEISGPGALAFLQRLCDNDMDRPPGSIIYTQMLNRRGGIECDFTMTRLDDDRFFIVTGTAFGNHDLSWMRKHQPDDGSVNIEDVTAARACLGIWGPRARDIIQPLPAADLS